MTGLGLMNGAGVPRVSYQPVGFDRLRDGSRNAVAGDIYDRGYPRKYLFGTFRSVGAAP